jgi:SAM-dependent methyltransferase
VDLAERPSAEFRRHPWELSRRRFFTGVLREARILERTQRVLDIGSGDGWFLTELLAEMPSASGGVGWDLGYEPSTLDALGLPRTPHLRFTQTEPDGRFSLLILLDVLEHVERDSAFLRERLARNLEPDGHVLISVPAWPALFTSHDTGLGHYRRYRPAELSRLLLDAGLSVLSSGGLFHTLTLPRALQRISELVRPVRAPTRPPGLEWRRGRAVTWAVERALAIDNALSRSAAHHGYGLPGLSVWALCARGGSG